MTTSIVQATTSKDALAILGASDDRELLSQGMDDFLPYDVEYECVVDVLEVKAKRNHDNRGVFVSMKVLESSLPSEVQPGKQYALAFFDQHKTIPEFVLAKILKSRRTFAATIAGAEDNDDFQAGKVLLQLHNEVEPLHIKLRLRNEYQRTTRGATPKKVHELKFELVK